MRCWGLIECKFWKNCYASLWLLEYKQSLELQPLGSDPSCESHVKVTTFTSVYIGWTYFSRLSHEWLWSAWTKWLLEMCKIAQNISVSVFPLGMVHSPGYCGYKSLHVCKLECLHMSEIFPYHCDGCKINLFVFFDHPSSHSIWQSLQMPLRKNWPMQRSGDTSSS